MAEWLLQTDIFLTNNPRKVLEVKGRVSHDDAVKKAEGINEQFHIRQDAEYIAELDREMAKYLKGGDDKGELRCKNLNRRKPTVSARIWRSI